MQNTSIYQKIVSEIQNGESQYYFYVPSASKHANAGVAYIYDLVKTLINNEFDAKIVHEKDYIIPEWMGEDYKKIPHCGFDKMKASDFLFIPELYIHPFLKDMEKANVKLPCDVVIVSQVYDFIYHSMDLGYEWASFRHKFGVSLRNVITTSDNQKKYIEQSMRGMNIHVVNPLIHSEFKPSSTPAKPFVMIVSRVKEEGEKLVKEFWNAFPHYRWIPFKLVNNVPRKQFASDVSECCVAVWIDNISSFGTFPLECMKSNVPVIGTIPSMLPEWMVEKQNIDGYDRLMFLDNGVWVTSKFDVLQSLRTFLDAWITQILGSEIYEEMQKTANKYTFGKYSEQVLSAIKFINEDRIAYLQHVEEKQKHNENIKNIKDAK